MPHDDEWRSAARLGGQTIGGAVGVVRDVHEAVLTRVESLLPDQAAPVTGLHRRISGALYSGVAVAPRLPLAVGADVASWRWGSERVAPTQTRAARMVLPALHGLWGDTIAEREPALAVTMSVRSGSRDVPIDEASIRVAFPDATGRLVVFVHGLCESDESWWRAPRAGDAAPPLSYGDRLRDHVGATPVYLRYNSGLRVSDNGKELAGLLSALTASWPVPVQRVDLVGHSMGGLIARSACHQDAQEPNDWTPRVGTVVTLGTPHLGAPLEKVVNVADWLLARLPETAPIGRLLRVRSLGVKDLRYGALVEEDWRGHDPDEFLRDRCTQVPFVEHVTYCWVAASLTKDAGHPIARLVGDGLVRYPSASGAGRTRRVPFPIGNGTHVGGVGHLALLNDPDVYDQVRTWLDEAG